MYPAKPSFRYEGEIKPFPDILKQTNRQRNPTLTEIQEKKKKTVGEKYTP